MEEKDSTQITCKPCAYPTTTKKQTGKKRKGERSLFELQFGFTMNTRQDNYLLSKRSSDSYGSVISDCINNDAGVY